METKLRWAKKADLNIIKDMCSSADPATPADFFDEQTRKTSVVCLVAEKSDEMIGFVFYEMRKNRIKINYLMVAPNHRRNGVGSSMVERLVSKLNEKRNHLVFPVSEYVLDLQLFLKHSGFIATDIIRNEDGSCDYKFVYELKGMVIS